MDATRPIPASARHGPHVEVIGPFEERRDRKQVLGQFPRRRFELAHFGGRVAVAHDQQVDLPGRGATDADRYRLDGCRRLLADHVLRGRIDIGTPHNGKQAALVALEDAHAHGVLGLRETHGFLERARGGFRFVGTGPFTEMVEKPREYSTLPDLISTTSSRLLPRLLSSMGRARLPGHGKGSTSTRSTA